MHKELPSVQLTKNGNIYTGTSIDHGATFTVHMDKQASYIHIIVPLQSKNKEGEPLITKKGNKWWRCWLKSFGINIAMFTSEDGAVLKISANG